MKGLGRWLIGVVVGLVGFLVIALKGRTAQRDNARQERNQARANAETQRVVRDVEHKVDAAQKKARESNDQARRERNAKPKRKRRTGKFGTADRLRD